MRQLVHIDSTTTTPSKLVSFGRAAAKKAENLALYIPVLRKVVINFASPAPVINPDSETGLLERRMESLQGFIEPLDFGMPPVTPPTALMDKASGLSIKLRKWQATNAEKVFFLSSASRGSTKNLTNFLLLL